MTGSVALGWSLDLRLHFIFCEVEMIMPTYNTVGKLHEYRKCFTIKCKAMKMTQEVSKRGGRLSRAQGHNGSFQALKGIHVEADVTQRGLCYRPRMNDGNEGVTVGEGPCHQNNI